jgi:hypothetical protein
MPTKPKKILANKKTASLYNVIQKEFRIINEKLPINFQLSLAIRRRIISQDIYPNFKSRTKREQGVRKIREYIYELIENIQPQPTCDVRDIPYSAIESIAWYDINEWITEVMPQCIYIQVNAGQFGITKIINTMNYSYERSGVRLITDKIREFVGNNSDTNASYSGYKKVRPRKLDDGSVENYYIEFILSLNYIEQGDVEEAIFPIARTQKDKKRKNSVKDAIIEKINNLKSKKRKVRRANTTIKKNLENAKKLQKKIQALKTPVSKARVLSEILKQNRKSIKALMRDYKNGLITKEKYEKNRKVFDQALEIDKKNKSTKRTKK